MVKENTNKEITQNPEQIGFNDFSELFLLELVFTPNTDGFISNNFPSKFKKQILNLASEYLGSKIPSQTKIFVSPPKKGKKFLFSNKIEIKKDSKYSVELKYHSKHLNQFFIEKVLLMGEKFNISIEDITFQLNSIRFSRPINKLSIFEKLVVSNKKLQVNINILTPLIFSPLLNDAKLPSLEEFLRESIDTLKYFVNIDESVYEHAFLELKKSRIKRLSLLSATINQKIGVYGSISFEITPFALLPYLLLLLEYLGFGEERTEGFGIINVSLKPLNYDFQEKSTMGV